MLPPHELKNKTFSRVLRGYNSVEVDEHIDFIIEKYTELYRQNDELERRLKIAEAQLAEFRADEESIRNVLVNAQKASAKIISEANERADMILRSARGNCNKVIASFKSEIQKERQELLALRRAVAEFKTRLFAQYQQHITFIEQISPDEDDTDIDTPDEVYVRRIVDRVKADIAAGNIPMEPSGIKVNTARKEETIIPVEKSEESDTQPAIREITPNAQPEAEPNAEPSLESEADKTAFTAPAEDKTFDDVAADEAEDDEDGGGYLDDTIIDLPPASNATYKAEEKFETHDSRDYRDDDTLPIDIIKPGDRPSTIAGKNESADAARGGQRNGAAYRSASVKDTIREINKKFTAGEGDSPATTGEKPTDEFTPDAEDEELLSIIRSVTSKAEEKDREYRNNKKKNKTKPLSLTEEFDLISDDDDSSDKK